MGEQNETQKKIEGPLREEKTQKKIEGLVIEEKQGKKECLLVRERKLRRVYCEKQSLVVLRYEETYLNLNDLNPSLPSVLLSVLQEFEDAFSEEILDGLPPIRRLSTGSTLPPDH